MVPPPLDTHELRSCDQVLRRLARRLVSSRADADDVVQETWLAALERPPRDNSAFTGWLRVVTIHSARRILARERSRRAREQRVARSGVTASLAEVAGVGGTAGAERWIARLSDPYREVVRLRYVEELSSAEIARRLDRPEVTVRSQLKRGLDQLRLSLRLRADAETRERDRTWAVFPFWSHWPRVAGVVAVTLVAFLGLELGSDARHSARAQASAAGHAPGIERGAAPIAGAGETVGGRQAAPGGQAQEPAGDAPFSEGAVDELHGSVRGPEGQPVAGAVIWGAPHESSDLRSPLGTTDEQGRYRASVPAGLHLWAEAEAYSPSARFDVDWARREHAGAVDLVFASPAFPLRGVVRDSLGSPVARARVRLDPRRESILFEEIGKGSAPPQFAWTDEEGRFELVQRACARQTLLVEAEGCAPSLQFFDRREEELRVDVQLAQPAKLAGSVLAPSAPANGADVELFFPGLDRGYHAATSSTGRFEFLGLPAGEFLLVARDGTRPLSLIARGRLEAGAAEDLGALRLDAGASIGGRATLDHRPIAGGRVRLRGRDGREIEAVTDPEGRFLFNGCPETTYEVWLSMEAERGLALAWLRDVTPGCLDLVLEGRTATRAAVRGVIRGAPAELEFLSRLELEGTALPDPMFVELERPSGRFAVRPLPPGEYELFGRSGPHRWSLGAFELARGADQVLEPDLPRLGAIVVRLLPPPGIDLRENNPSFELQRNGVSTFFRARTLPEGMEWDAARGLLRVEALLPGSYELVVRTRSVASEACRFEIAGGEARHLEVPLERGLYAKVQAFTSARLEAPEDLLLEVHSANGRVRAFRRSRNACCTLDSKPWGDVGLGLPLDATRILARTLSGSLSGESTLDPESASGLEGARIQLVLLDASERSAAAR